MLSNKPGLYKVAGGYGYNHGNHLLVTPTGGRQIRAKPMMRKGWCPISI